MARARRAAARPARSVVPIVVIVLVAAIAVAAAVWRLQAGTTVAGPDPTLTTPSAVASTDGQGSGAGDEPTTATPSATPTTAQATPSASSAPASDSAAAAAALKTCRATVAAGDDVVAAAATGVGHWSEHVKAQTDFNDREISYDEMDAIFKRTRLAGPDDTKAWNQALDARADADAGDDDACTVRGDAGEDTVAALTTCQQRLTAQQPVVAAGKAGMADWGSHQKAMARSRHEHVDDAQGIWDRAWAAAPPNIKAFDAALEEYRDDTPDC